MSKLYRLVYTSFRSSDCDNLEIGKILKSCKKNNPGNGITGVLIHSEYRFLQYIEGELEKVEELFGRIKEDPRHGSIEVRNFEKITERAFPTWEMAYKNIPSQEPAFNTKIDEQHKNRLDEILNGKLNFENEGLKLLKLFFKAA